MCSATVILVYNEARYKALAYGFPRNACYRLLGAPKRVTRLHIPPPAPMQALTTSEAKVPPQCPYALVENSDVSQAGSKRKLEQQASAERRLAPKQTLNTLQAAAAEPQEPSDTQKMLKGLCGCEAITVFRLYERLLLESVQESDRAQLKDSLAGGSLLQTVKPERSKQAAGSTSDGQVRPALSFLSRKLKRMLDSGYIEVLQDSMPAHCEMIKHCEQYMALLTDLLGVQLETA